jgi:hypothetical protein
MDSPQCHIFHEKRMIETILGRHRLWTLHWKCDSLEWHQTICSKFTIIRHHNTGPPLTVLPKLGGLRGMLPPLQPIEIFLMASEIQ